MILLEKYLPIKFIHKRNDDDRRTEPGGGKTIPSWYLSDKELYDRAKHLTDEMSSIDETFQKRKAGQHELPMVMATTITSEALAKSHRSNVTTLLNMDDTEDNIIGVDGITESFNMDKDKDIPLDNDTFDNAPVETAEDNTEPVKTVRILSLVTSDKLIANINRALSQRNDNVGSISTITDMEPFEPVVGDYNPENKMYRVKLHDYQDREYNKKAQTVFERQCEKSEIKINHRTRYTEDMLVYRITCEDENAFEAVRTFDGVYSIEEAIPVQADDESLDAVPKVEPKRPVKDKKYPVVGVLDSGIEANDYYDPWLLDDSEVYYPDSMQDKQHGSMVAGVLEYSDELNGTDYCATDGVKMFEAIVVPDFKKNKIYMEDILDDVRRTIEQHRDIKVWTMSIGTSTESALDRFSVYGMALDNIEDENGVLIIKSAGNSSAFLRGMPNERIAESADSVRSVVVGSIAGDKGKHDKAEIDMPSPFTRIGPGPESIIKPDLVAYGGNAGYDNYGNMTQTGIYSVSASGNIVRTIGTSFSTPWVARVASELEFLLKEDFDPLLIKALLVHSADYPAGNKLKMNEKSTYMGFGMPKGAADILYNSESEITLIIRDTLPKGSFIEMLDFPFPQSLAGADGFYHGEIKVTLVTNPILKTSEGPEYCQSNLNILFGTMSGIKDRDIEKRNILNPYGPDDATNVLNSGHYSSKVIKKPVDDDFARERFLIQYGKKYHPIKKYAVNLDDMKPAVQRDCLKTDYKWFMRIEGNYREAVERKARRTGEILEQRFCALITISDPSGKAPVYTEITQQLSSGRFHYEDVELKNEVRQRVRTSEDEEDL